MLSSCRSADFVASDLLDATDELRFRGSPWHLDARFPRSHAIVSHAHSDHLGRHGRVIAHPITCDLLAHRLGDPADARGGEAPELAATTQLAPLPHGAIHREDGLEIELFPAGHVLGSAMPRITTARGRLLYTGDFRYAPGRDALTVPGCALPSDGADVVLMECTYGLPRYRFPVRGEVIERLCDSVAAAFAEGKQPVCLCYSLGKAQEVARILAENGFAIAMHGAAHAITEIYHRHGVRVGEVRRHEAGNIEGTVLIAPPHIRNSRMIASIKNAHILVVTGWAIDSGATYRYQAAEAFPLSDHCDFDQLNAFVDAMRERGARHFLLTHGFVNEFGRHLRARGVSASPAVPPRQLALFDD
ncbi:MAG TPA: MBL fold metallo-hydrolase [Phycisphaerae bacterium]|nr:MBL fold metallo-hydrolase [Phycisphaerae bacterium]